LNLQRIIVSVLKEWKISAFLLDTSKKLVLPGFNDLPVYNVATFFVKGITKGDITSRASSLSFNFFLALFPGIIFLFTLIPYVPINNFQDQLLNMIKDVMPRNAYQATRETIEDIIKHQRGGLLSIGFITALYFSTNGIHAIIGAFNKTYHAIETRSGFKQRLVSIMLTMILFSLLLIAIAIIIFGEISIHYFTEKGLLENIFTFYLILAAKWITILVLLIFAFSILYYFGPAKKGKWRFISPGSLLATILSILTSLGFNYFVNNFGQYNKLYGSIGTLIVVLLWIYFNSIILLIGFELNASIDHAKRKLS
jgi:membrane protein